MTMVFHGSDNNHAPFPHRVVVIQPRTVLVRDPDTRKIRKVTYPKQEFVICSNCDHWILRYVVSCECEYRCHGLGELLAELAVNDVESNEKDRQGSVIREATS